MNTICNVCGQEIGEEEREHWEQGLVFHESCWLEPFRSPTLAESLDRIEEEKHGK